MGEIRTEEVRAAADVVSEVARTVRCHVPDEVGGIASALSGGAAGGAGTSLATAWTDAYTGWATRTEAHAQSLRDTAETWEAVDSHTAAGFRQFSGGPTRHVPGGMEAV